MRKAATLIVWAGIILIIGSVGEADINKIELTTSIHRCLIGFIIVFSGTGLYKAATIEKQLRRKRKQGCEVV